MFNKNEITLLEQAIDQAIASQKRGQNSSKHPQFFELYKRIEQELVTLKTKILAIPPTK